MFARSKAHLQTSKPEPRLCRLNNPIEPTEEKNLQLLAQFQTPVSKSTEQGLGIWLNTGTEFPKHPPTTQLHSAYRKQTLR